MRTVFTLVLILPLELETVKIHLYGNHSLWRLTLWRLQLKLPALSFQLMRQLEIQKPSRRSSNAALKNHFQQQEKEDDKYYVWITKDRIIDDSDC